MADWTLTTGAQEHLDEHNQFDHTDLASLTEGRVLGVVGGIIKQLSSIDILSRVGVKKNGTLVASRRNINLVEGSNITLSVTDDAANEEVDVVITGAAGGGGSGGLEVVELSSNTVLTASGVYVVDTSGGNRTLTLPLLSSTPAAGFRIQVIRVGTNAGNDLVYLNGNGSDEFWDGTTQKTIWDDYGAMSVVAGATSSVWLELGRYRTVT